MSEPSALMSAEELAAKLWLAPDNPYVRLLLDLREAYEDVHSASHGEICYCPIRARSDALLRRAK